MAEKPSGGSVGSGSPRHADEPALGKRVERFGGQLSSQHRQLDVFFGMVQDALERGSLVAARQAFMRFNDALDAHITLEDRVFFPALHGLDSSIAGELRQLAEDHQAVRVSLDELSDLLAAGSVEAFSEGFDHLAVLFSKHEKREEELVARAGGHRGAGPA
jgi:iron-sulfur cluster repair protein YtfE (RIC family)